MQVDELDQIWLKINENKLQLIGLEGKSIDID